jgi:hypothetical protein
VYFSFVLYTLIIPDLTAFYHFFYAFLTIVITDSGNTNVTLEYRNNKTKKKGKSIQDSLFEILMEQSEIDYIIYDHSSGEMADFITIENAETEFKIALYHVKSMSAKNYNSSLNDIYEVMGQSVKSIIWLKTKSTFLQKIRQRRKSEHCIFKKGSYDDFIDMIKKEDKVLRGKVVAVQPSISKNKVMPDKIQEVLAATKYYISNSGKVNAFEVWGS